MAHRPRVGRPVSTLPRRSVLVEYVGGPFDGAQERRHDLPPTLYREESDLLAAMVVEERLQSAEEFVRQVHEYARRPLSAIRAAPVRYDWRPR